MNSPHRYYKSLVLYDVKRKPQLPPSSFIANLVKPKKEKKKSTQTGG